MGFEQNLEFLKEETKFETSGLGGHSWFMETTEQHNKNLSDQPNPRNKPAQDSLGTLFCICILQATALHPQACLLRIFFLPRYKSARHDSAVRVSKHEL